MKHFHIHVGVENSMNPSASTVPSSVQSRSKRRLITPNGCSKTPV